MWSAIAEQPEMMLEEDIISEEREATLLANLGKIKLQGEKEESLKVYVGKIKVIHDMKLRPKNRRSWNDDNKDSAFENPGRTPTERKDSSTGELTVEPIGGNTTSVIGESTETLMENRINPDSQPAETK